MIPTFSSQTESDEFLTLSDTIRAGNYEDALQMSMDMLERYPDNAFIYHNQVGAMYYEARNAYWSASRHYYQAYELGFYPDTCEDNIWESAEDSFIALIDAEEGFCSVFNRENGEVVAYTYTLIEQYRETFPKGKYKYKADELSFLYDALQPGVFNNREIVLEAYIGQFPNGNYRKLLDELCDIYFK